MKIRLAFATLLLASSACLAQTTQPSTSVDAALELRATQAFTRGEYSVALPMLQKEADALKALPDRADKLSMVQEQIRVCQKNMPVQVADASAPATPNVTATGNAAATVADPNAPAPIATGTDRKPHAKPKDGDVLELPIKELGNFEFDAEHGSPLPDDIKALSGSTIRLHGYMIPMDSAESISKFALVPSLFACCFGQPPQIQHTIVVSCPKGKAVSYYPDEIIVEGKLNVEVKKDDGFIVSIFDIDTTSVKPAAK